ncbi:MAG: hypothetical protein CVU60_15290 [Deltaproteobacteria bacterium HGW-Deltaproteobacteria-18]|jgi:hypothetical protein|nr:MAG: hypothetical protein CVU60_15290 [Deltaproteobacteria bacterium HGW-Deltaproteobacteria-18]
MDWVVNLFNMILSGFQEVINFFTEDIFALIIKLGDFLYSFLEMLFYDCLYYCIITLQYLIDIFLQNVDLADSVNTQWTYLSAEHRAAAVFFRLPQIMTIFVSAMSVRLLRALIPFF